MGVDGFHKWLHERRLTRPEPLNLAVACVCVDADILHTCARRASTARELVQQVVTLNSGTFASSLRELRVEVFGGVN